MAYPRLNSLSNGLHTIARIALLLMLTMAGCVGSSGCEDASQVQMRTLNGSDSAAPAVPAVEIVLDGQTFVLELAADSDTRFQGLSDRPAISEHGGMLFVFPTAQQLTFVMRKCLVPIDIAFLDPTGRVLAKHQMEVEPYDTPERNLRRYSSRWPAQYVIEVKGGTWDQIDLNVGDKVDLPLEELRTLAR